VSRGSAARVCLRGVAPGRIPSTDDEQAVHVAIPYPTRRSTPPPLVKWILAVPHYVILCFLGCACFCVIGACLILFTGRYPRSLFDFVVGVS
jgi:hypothetical protein